MQFQQQQQRLQATKSQHPHGLPGAGLMASPGGMVAPLGAKGQGSGIVGTGGTPIAAAYYQSPTFANHIEQLGKLTPPLLSFFYRAMFVLD